MTSNNNGECTRPGHEYTITLPGADTSELRTGRGFVRTQLAGRVPDRTCEMMQLTASELVSNALTHGSPGPVFVTVRVDPDQAWLRVASQTDNGAAVPPIDEWEMAGPAALSGRGLGIVRAVSDRVDLSRSSRQLAITAYFHL